MRPKVFLQRPREPRFSISNFSERSSAPIVLADEGPLNQSTPFAPDHPDRSISPQPLSSNSSAPINIEHRPGSQHLNPQEQLTAVNRLQSTSLYTPEGRFQESRSRRRQRSPSLESEGTFDSGEVSVSGNLEFQHREKDSSTAEIPWHRQEAHPAPKRRRLMTQDMRHELPTASNGNNCHVNGATHFPQKNGFTNGTNGHTSSTNGVNSVHVNGFSPFKAKARAPYYYGHNREEVTRLLIQALEDLGYDEAAETLSQESDFQVESPAVAAFRRAILEGKWSEAELLLFGRRSEADEGGVRIGNGDSPYHSGIKLIEAADSHHMKFLIRERKYVELLARNLRGQALIVLQSELQPLNYDTRRLDVLSGQVSPSLSFGFILSCRNTAARLTGVDY